jgi:hypothetical protein
MILSIVEGGILPRVASTTKLGFPVLWKLLVKKAFDLTTRLGQLSESARKVLLEGEEIRNLKLKVK